jgi:hypothetical protein
MDFTIKNQKKPSHAFHLVPQLVIDLDKNPPFESGIRENLRLCAVTGSMPIYSRAEYHKAIILRQPTAEIKITDSGRIVKKAFFSKRAEMLEFWE